MYIFGNENKLVSTMLLCSIQQVWWKRKSEEIVYTGGKHRWKV